MAFLNQKFAPRVIQVSRELLVQDTSRRHAWGQPYRSGGAQVSALVVIARFASRPECVIAQSLLRSEGIETLMPEFNVLMAELDPSMMEHGWRLMGRSDDVFKAQAILRDAQLDAGDRPDE